MDKIDFKKSLKALYGPPTDVFVSVEVPQMQFVKVDGHGDPNTSPAYRTAIEWLYGTSYAMKFDAKKTLDRDYVVPPLEGLWWADDPAAFRTRAKNQWHCTMMILVPDFIPRSMFEAAITKTRSKAGDPPQSLRLEPLTEGLSLQILHVGSYDDEAPVLARLHDELMPAKGLTFNGPHHEIYLSDPRRTQASRLKTVLRQPVRPAT